MALLLWNLSKFTYNTTKLTFHNCLTIHVNVVNIRMFILEQGSRWTISHLRKYQEATTFFFLMFWLNIVGFYRNPPPLFRQYSITVKGKDFGIIILKRCRFALSFTETWTNDLYSLGFSLLTCKKMLTSLCRILVKVYWNNVCKKVTT